MADAPFDLSGAVTFDLSSGRVSLAHASARVLTPVDGLVRLCEAAGEDATRDLGHAMGVSMGRRILQQVTQPGMEKLTVEAFLAHLRGEIALAGLGDLTIEHWGKALLFVVDHAEVPSTLMAALLDGALEVSTGRKTACVELMRAHQRSRFLVSAPGTAERVSSWLGDGLSWGEVMAKLHVRGAATEGRGEA